jgi:hypothetical protein
MPTYTFYDNQTGKEFDALIKISEREDYLKNNPHITQVITAPTIVSSVSTSNKIKYPKASKKFSLKLLKHILKVQQVNDTAKNQ